MTNPLLLPPPSIHTKRLTATELAAMLEAASEHLHGDTMSPWRRTQECLLYRARDALLAVTRRYEGARRVNERLRQQRNEARQGVVKATWWNDEDDPENGYDHPSEALDYIGPNEVVSLTGSAEIERRYGFRVVVDEEADETADFWFNTKAEAIEALEKELASKAAATKAAE